MEKCANIENDRVSFAGILSTCQKTKQKLKVLIVKKYNVLVIVTILLSVISSSHGLPNNFNDKTKRIETNNLINTPFMKKIMGGVREAHNENHKAHHRAERFMPQVMVPVRDRMTSSLCSYKVQVDVNPVRIPNKIDRVLCQVDSCKCVEQGDYRCTQLYAQMNVTYLTNDLKSNFDFEMINVEYACVCSRGSGSPGVKVLEPILV